MPNLTVAFRNFANTPKKLKIMPENKFRSRKHRRHRYVKCRQCKSWSWDSVIKHNSQTASSLWYAHLIISRLIIVKSHSQYSQVALPTPPMNCHNEFQEHVPVLSVFSRKINDSRNSRSHKFCKISKYRSQYTEGFRRIGIWRILK
jgi:hypothetical protein